MAPSFAWCAVPVAFAVLRVLPFGWAVATVVAMTVLVTGAWLRITDGVDPDAGGRADRRRVGHGAGLPRARPGVAGAAGPPRPTWSTAQADLGEEQQRTGALAERTRLSREIHDSRRAGPVQHQPAPPGGRAGLGHPPAAAREHVRTAASTARDGLDEVRRVVRDLAPADLAVDGTASALPAALRRAAEQAAPGMHVEVRVDGAPVPVPAEVAAALVRTARGALANVVEHAAAQRVAMTLTYQPDEVVLDVRDDGAWVRPRSGRCRRAPRPRPGRHPRTRDGARRPRRHRERTGGGDHGLGARSRW